MACHAPVLRLHATAMTELTVGVVDVHVIRPLVPEWRVLVLQRSHTTRCPGAWESVHGRIQPDERPEDAAVREVREETGLAIERLYNVTCHPFYLHREGAVRMAVVFAALVAEPGALTLGPEHQRAEWVAVAEALERFAWPRERATLREIVALLAGGDAGAVEDVLRVF